MPEFILDESGDVDGRAFRDLSYFARGYIEAMFFTNQSCISMVEWHTEESQERVREGQADGELPNDAGFSDLHPDSLVKIITDCAAFEDAAEALLKLAYERDYDSTQAGRDFWFTRCGHGVGFWSRDELEEGGLGEALSFAARGFGNVDPYFSEAEEEDSPTGYGWVYLF